MFKSISAIKYLSSLLPFVVALIAVTFIALVISGAFITTTWLAILTAVSLSIFFSVLILFSIQYTRFGSTSLAQQFNVGIVGFPRSGKTTLIVALFGEIFRGNIPDLSVTPKGTETIERINASLQMLEKGRAIGPTSDQDRHAFRADVNLRSFPIPRIYKVEFGDFPGDDSAKYSKKYGPWLHNTEFFKWVVDSDAMVFVVDLGLFLRRDKDRIAYIAEMSSALRAAFQHFLDSNSYRIKQKRRNPVVLVFTKADLFGVKIDSNEWDVFERKIERLGFGHNVPPNSEIDTDSFQEGKAQVLEAFSDLIIFFNNEAPNFHILFTSCFGLIDNKRLGISALLKAVLPR